MDETKMRRQIQYAKTWKTIIFAFSVIIALIILAGLAFFTYQNTFTVEKWFNEPNDRTNIVDDLLEKHSLVGMTKEEIISLLGEEDDYANTKTSFKIKDNYFEPENTIVYYLGVEYMDDMWLVISLDNNMVSSYCIDVT